MKLRKLIMALTVPGMMIAASNSAVGYDSGNQILEAPVLSANPIYRTVEINKPVEQCWEEAVAVPHKGYISHTAKIFGAIIGAAIGNQFGSGRGQDAATLAGAVLGGSIGRDQSQRNQSYSNETRYEQRCKVVNEYHSEERLEGYKVTYQYNGNVYTTRTKHDPGNTIKISVNVVPVE